MVVIMVPQTPPAFPFGGRTHRPAISSPLSSSPLRAPPSSPPHAMQQSTWHPLSPCNSNFLNTLPRQPQQQQQQHFPQRATHSSPILPTPSPSTVFGSSPALCGGSGITNNDTSTPGGGSSSSKFRFAARDPRPNPVLKRRDDAQEGRRRLFLQNVRQRREDRRWEARGGEDELLKLEWWRLNRERQLAKDAEAAAYLGLGDDDVEILEQEEEKEQNGFQQQEPLHEEVDADALMADAIAREEQAEVDALVSALDGDTEWQSQSRRSSAHFSDDDDYDGLFMELIQQQDGQGIHHSQDVEMT